jgi:MFS family permease
MGVLSGPMSTATAPASQITDAQRRRNLFAACAAIVVFGFAMGLTYPLLSLIMERNGVSESVIGMNAAMAPLGVLAFSVLIPVLTRRHGARAVTLGAAAMAAVILIGYKALPQLEAWFVLRLFHGMAISALFVLSESWIVKFADPGSRGKIVAIYGAALAASFGAGPALISVIGIDGWAPFVIGAGVLIAAMVPLAMVRDDRPAAEEHAGWSDIVKFLPVAPVLLSAVFIFAVLDAATLSLIPVYGVRLGYDVATAANLLTVLIAGNVVLLIPIGWLIDTVNRRVVLAGLAGRHHGAAGDHPAGGDHVGGVAGAVRGGRDGLWHLHLRAGHAGRPVLRPRADCRGIGVRHHVGLGRAARLADRGRGNERLRPARPAAVAGGVLRGVPRRHVGKAGAAEGVRRGKGVRW